MTKTSTKSDHEWQRVVQQMTRNTTTNENEWQWMTARVQVTRTQNEREQSKESDFKFKNEAKS